MSKRPNGSNGISPAQNNLLDQIVDIRQNPDAAERAYMARQLVQCTLPHRDPGNVPVWSRTNGSLTLKIRPDFDDKTQRPLYPYGSIPRLLLFWLVTEAKRTGERTIKLGTSLDAFMRAVGLNPRTGGGKRSDAKRLQAQMLRLFQATISFEDKRGVAHANMTVSRKSMLWWNARLAQTQDTLFESWVELSEDFYQALIASSVPVDFRALKALKRSPLALDLYALVAYKTDAANKKAANGEDLAPIPWKGLHGQMGAEYKEMFHFKAEVKKALKKIALVSEMRWDLTEYGLKVHPGKTPIPTREPKTIER